MFIINVAFKKNRQKLSPKTASQNLVPKGLLMSKDSRRASYLVDRAHKEPMATA